MLLIIMAKHKTVDDGNGEMVELFLQHKFEVNAKNNWGRSPVHIAAQNGNFEIVSLLINTGAKIQLLDNSGQTPLHCAAISGYREPAELLIEHGANINAKDEPGCTPLFVAGKFGHKTLAEYLKSRGAKADNLVENYCNFPFSEHPVADGEAIIWYLGHSGWAIKTKQHFLIFDYYEDRKPPAEPRLANGFISPDEIKNFDVDVFASHVHTDYFDSTILKWQEEIPNIKYIFGWKAMDNPTYFYMESRSKIKINNLEIESIHSPEAGAIDGNLLVKLDGLVIYHSGDYSRGHDFFKQDMAYLAQAAGTIDLFIMLAGNEMDNEEAIIALEKVKPKYMFPMHQGEESMFFRDLLKKSKPESCLQRLFVSRIEGIGFDIRTGMC